jgi:hypothetical protein
MYTLRGARISQRSIFDVSIALNCIFPLGFIVEKLNITINRRLSEDEKVKVVERFSLVDFMGAEIVTVN